MENYINKKFTRLLVLKEVDHIIEKNGKKRTAYLCRCDCGKELIVSRHSLQVKNGTKSCGCLRDEHRSRLGLSKRKLEPDIASGKIIYKNTYADGDLTFEKFLELSKNNCFYCGIYPKNNYNKFLHRKKHKVSQYGKDNGLFIYNGLDRINSNLPHNIDNIVSACKNCNWAKNNLTLEEFKEWVIKVFNNYLSKK